MQESCKVLANLFRKIIENYDGNGDGICETI